MSDHLKSSSMFAIGILLFAIGCAMCVYLKLSARSEVRQLMPQRMSHRTAAIQTMKTRRRPAMINATILMVAGALVILHSAVFN